MHESKTTSASNWNVIREGAKAEGEAKRREKITFTLDQNTHF